MPDDEKKEALDYEKRQYDFGRENIMLQSEAGSDADQVYLQQQETRSDLIKWQQDIVEQELDILRHTLRNEVKVNGEWKRRKIYLGLNPETGKKRYRYMRPLLNDHGIQMIETECQPLLSRNLMMSNLDNRRILSMLKNTCNTIVSNLGENYDYYIINCEENAKTNILATFDHVMRIVKNTVIPTPFRALNNGERKYLTTISKRVETHAESEPIKRDKKLFGFSYS